MTRVANTLTRWPFLAALTILLLNDFWLKSQFPGLITGKLSDFAGIALVALPLLAAFPRRARAIYLGIAAAFLWWKSPLSAPLIDFANDVLPYRIGRVVDYTDLLALLVLPFCSHATREVCVESGRLRRALAVPVIAIAVFATAATSMPPAPQVVLIIRPVYAENVLDRAVAAEAIESVMKDFRLPCIECARRERNGTYRSDDVTIYYYFGGSNSVYFQIYWFNGAWGDGEERRAARIKEALKVEFTKRFKGLEAVEPLRGPYDRWPPPCVSDAASTPHCTATGQVAPTEAPP
jgi:hypothetical protein